VRREAPALFYYEYGVPRSQCREFAIFIIFLYTFCSIKQKHGLFSGGGALFSYRNKVFSQHNGALSLDNDTLSLDTEAESHDTTAFEDGNALNIGNAQNRVARWNAVIAVDAVAWNIPAGCRGKTRNPHRRCGNRPEHREKRDDSHTRSDRAAPRDVRRAYRGNAGRQKAPLS
jgi:hypothetical protein